MWKAPYRPDNKITQSFNDGIATIWSVSDDAALGNTPTRRLKEIKMKARYEERRLGVQRYYVAQQNQIQISRVLRIPAGTEITNQDILVDERGVQYRIDLVQIVTNVFPKSMDLTLYRIDQKIEVSNDMD